jgi:hypothetical protein
MQPERQVKVVQRAHRRDTLANLRLSELSE